MTTTAAGAIVTDAGTADAVGDDDVVELRRSSSVSTRDTTGTSTRAAASIT